MPQNKALTGLGAFLQQLGQGLGQKAMLDRRRDEGLEDDKRRRDEKKADQLLQLQQFLAQMGGAVPSKDILPFMEQQPAGPMESLNLSSPARATTGGQTFTSNTPSVLTQMTGGAVPAAQEGEDVSVTTPRSMPTDVQGILKAIGQKSQATQKTDRELKERALNVREFETSGQPGSRSFTRNPTGIAQNEIARQAARLPMTIIKNAMANNVDPFNPDGSMKSRDILTRESVENANATAQVKQDHFNEQMTLAKNRVTAAATRAERANTIKITMSPLRKTTLEDQSYVKKKKAEITDLRKRAERIGQMFYGPGQQILGLFGTLELTKIVAQLSDDEDVRFARDFIARVENFTAEVRHELYGAALTETELPRALSAMPSPENAVATILDQLTIQEESLDKVGTYVDGQIKQIDALLSPTDQMLQLDNLDSDIQEAIDGGATEQDLLEAGVTPDQLEPFFP